jgi:sugar lactone lactonase YvrE
MGLTMQLGAIAYFLCAAAAQPASASAPALEVFAEIAELPGNIAVTPDGRVVVSLHQFRPSAARVLEVKKDGSTKAFPDERWNRGEGGHDSLDTVLGIRSDRDGVVWLLDNAMRGKSMPKLVAWDTQSARVRNIVFLPPPVTAANSFVNDLQVDPAAKTVYIADPAGGSNAALIVTDLATGKSRRVLEGHKSVVPEDVDLSIDGRVLELRRADDTRSAARVGVNPIALDAKNEWLYFGPMSGSSLYRVRTADLRNVELTTTELGSRVEKYAERPPCDGITIDVAGNIYVTEITGGAIGVISAERKYRRIIEDRRLSWPDAFSFGPDGWMYVVANQLHRTAPLNGGKDETARPYQILRFKPPAEGVVGR